MEKGRGVRDGSHKCRNGKREQAIVACRGKGKRESAGWDEGKEGGGGAMEGGEYGGAEGGGGGGVGEVGGRALTETTSEKGPGE